MRKEFINTNENESRASQRASKNDRCEVDETCRIMPCCHDPGPNGPGGNRVEGVYFGDDEKINWGIHQFPVSKQVQEDNLWWKMGGDEIKIAVLDTGIALNHFDFFDNIPDKPLDLIKDSILNMNNSLINIIVKWLRGLTDILFNRPSRLPAAIPNCRDFTRSPFGVLDLHGHGTHVAGIIAARDNGKGVVGVAPKVKLLIGKVLGDTGGGSHKALTKGIQWAINQDAHIISISLGSCEYNEKVHNAIKKAVEKGIFIICSAGNKIHKDQTLVPGDREKHSLEYPAKLPETISVGAINWESGKTYYSLEKDQEEHVDIDIVAPGDKITSSFPPQICYPGHICAVLSGTSMAAAFVSGVAALILAKHRKYEKEGKINNTEVKTREQLIEHLKTIAVSIDSKRDDPREGYLIDPESIDEKFQKFSNK